MQKEPEAYPTVIEAAKAMDASIQGELASMESVLRSEMARCAMLAEDAPFANGLAKAAGTWRRDLGVLADKIHTEAESVTAALTGKNKPEITQTTNPELAAAAASDPDRRKP